MNSSTDASERRTTWAEHLLVRGGVLVVAALLLSALGGWTKGVRAADERASLDTIQLAGSMVPIDDELDSVRREVATVKAQLDRAQTIMKYSTKYQIPADLSSAIFDAAVAEGIEPMIAYRLVKVESNFKAAAKSHAAAIGYAQVQLATAEYYVPGISEAELYDRDTNLRVGFRFLKSLLVKFDGDMHLALLAYNRGPARVASILAEGGDPANGYAKAVLQGYRPMQVRASVRD